MRLYRAMWTHLNQRAWRPLFVLLATGLIAELAWADDPPMNVVLIVVDDLRSDETGLLQTPNLDALAAQGLSFSHAYAPVPICGSSRAAFLSGVLPVRGQPSPYNAGPTNVTTLPDTFRAAGYRTRFLGKVYHNLTDDANGWSEGVWRSSISWLFWQNQSPTDPNTGRGPAYESGVGVDDAFYADGDAANHAIQDINTLSQTGQPFFLAVGFDRPHLPFNAPDRYWDLYDPGAIVLPTDRAPPAGSPSSLTGSGELTQYGGVPNMQSRNTDGAFSDDLRRNLIHGYLASTTYADAQLGRVIQALSDPNGDGDESDSIRDQTIIALVTDHGYHLGEHGFWGKHNLLETAVEVPMIIHDPRRTEIAGQSSDALVSLMDVYPTLASLAELDTPSHVEGNDLTMLLENPDRPWAEYVYSHFNSGDSIRTDRYRYIQWTHGQETLYDLIADPGETQDVLGTAPTDDVDHLRSLLDTHFEQGWQPFPPVLTGDLNFDGEIDVQDYAIYLSGLQVDLSGLTPDEAYQTGDLNGDMANDLADFLLFRAAFNAANGAGAFQAMLAGVPEPAAWILAFAGLCGSALGVRNRH